jgi:ArsR family transcriptional regulator
MEIPRDVAAQPSDGDGVRAGEFGCVHRSIGFGGYHRVMAMNGTGAAAPPNLAVAVALFRSLADPTRLAIVRRLSAGQSRVVDLVGELGMAQSTVSGHLACLRDCGLVTGRPEGRQVFYALAHPELMDMLGAAEALLVATGEAVALCPNYGECRDER